MNKKSEFVSIQLKLRVQSPDKQATTGSNVFCNNIGLIGVFVFKRLRWWGH